MREAPEPIIAKQTNRQISIAAEPGADGYVYSIKPPGIGWYLPFFKVIDGHSYGVFDEAELKQFKMLARDGVDLPYRKSPPSACRV